MNEIEDRRLDEPVEKKLAPTGQGQHGKGDCTHICTLQGVPDLKQQYMATAIAAVAVAAV